MVASFVARLTGEPDYWQGYNTLAFHDARGLKVGFVYNRFTGTDVQIHVAARPGALWAHPDILYHGFGYPFLQMGVKRVTAVVRKSNERSLKLVQSLGYSYEGTLREAHSSGDDLLLWGMLRRECSWLGYNERGSNAPSIQIPASTAGTRVH